MCKFYRSQCIVVVSSNSAAAAAKSLQSCPTLCSPIDGSPPGSAVPGILQARTLEWVAISFSNAWKWKVKVKSLSRVQLFHGIFQETLEPVYLNFSSCWLSVFKSPAIHSFIQQIFIKCLLWVTHYSRCLGFQWTKQVPSWWSFHFRTQDKLMEVAISLFSMWVSFCSINTFLNHFLDSTCKWYHTKLVFLWLTSLNMTSLGSSM